PGAWKNERGRHAFLSSSYARSARAGAILAGLPRTSAALALLGRRSRRARHRRRTGSRGTGRRAAGGGALVEAHCRHRAVALVRLEEGERLEAERPCDQRRGKGLQRDVVVAHVAVVEAARELDLVLGGGQSLLQVGEGRDRLQVGVVLGNSEQAAQALARHVLGLAD